MEVWVVQLTGGLTLDSFAKVFRNKEKATDYFKVVANDITTTSKISWVDIDEDDWKYDGANGVELFLRKEKVIE